MSEKIVEIPEGTEVRQDGTSLTVKGTKGELTRDFSSPLVKAGVRGSKVVFTSSDERKKTIAILGTFAAHIRNMVGGVNSGWETRLKAVYSHFPMKLGVEGENVQIQNFMGERKPRHARIVGQTKVDIQKDEIIITGNDKEDVGQTAANIEQTTKVTKFDRRIFQDGVWKLGKCKMIDEKKE